MIDKLKNNPVISLIIICSAIIPCTVGVTTWFYERQLDNYKSKIDSMIAGHQSEISSIKNNYEKKINTIEKQCGNSIELNNKNKLLNEEIIKLKKQINLQKSDVKNNTATRKQVNNDENKIVITKGYTFEIEKCVKNDKTINCYVWVTSNDKSKPIDLHASYGTESTKLYDNYGGEYICKKIEFGNKASEAYVDDHELIPKMRTRALFHFDNIPDDMEMIKQLVIKGEDESPPGENGIALIVHFQDIVLQK